VQAPSQRRALGALFLVLAALFGGVAFMAAQAARDRAGLWVVAFAAAALGAWLLSLSARALRRTPG
jgi:hypothetical protein